MQCLCFISAAFNVFYRYLLGLVLVKNNKITIASKGIKVIA